MRSFLVLLLAAVPGILAAQAKKTTKPRCNPIVLGQLPKKAMSLQYELQTGFNSQYRTVQGVPLLRYAARFNNAQGIRFNFNRNIVVKPQLYVSMDIGYWYSQFAAGEKNLQPVLAAGLDGTPLHSFTASANIFKPLDAKHFLLVNISAEFNGNGQSMRKPGISNLFGGGAVFFGWKKGISSMLGVGVLRAYRLGRVVHVPALLLNRNFNKQWGVEMLLPARALVRYAPNKNSFVTAGYELEGGQFAFAAPGTLLHNSFFQRGEIRPRLGWETALGKNTRLTLSTGVRINGRMQFARNYDGKALLIDNDPDANLFVNAGLHLLNIKKSSKKKK